MKMDTNNRAEPIPPFAVNGAFAGTVTYNPGGTYGPRLQEDLQLVLLHSGSMTVTIDGTKHTVAAGQTALLKPGHMEHFAFAAKRETWHRWIAVSVEPLTAAAVAQFDRLPLALRLSDQMNQLTDTILSLQRDGTAADAELLRTLGRSAVLLFLEEHNRTSFNDGKHPSVLIAKEAIHSQYADELDLSQLAHLAGMSPEHLIRLFRRDEGMTPIQYLWKYRAKQGVDLLSSTGLTIGEVAEQAGFKTSYHFARTIKNHTGQTPSDIRKDSFRQ
jgi:AraC family transcriptional regulator of arabinose operon